ncbi:MAG: hypothetical protein V5A79_06290, partial [Candidatus Bipolaricaulota bacterium]
ISASLSILSLLLDYDKERAPNRENSSDAAHMSDRTINYLRLPQVIDGEGYSGNQMRLYLYEYYLLYMRSTHLKAAV